jgi:hypothetical protein
MPIASTITAVQVNIKLARNYRKAKRKSCNKLSKKFMSPARKDDTGVGWFGYKRRKC